MKYTYKPKKVCPSKIEFDLTDNVVTNIEFTGGCNGNLKAIAMLCEGKTVDELEALLAGNTCGFKSTSCADQLVQGLLEAKNQ